MESNSRVEHQKKKRVGGLMGFIDKGIKEKLKEKNVKVGRREAAAALSWVCCCCGVENVKKGMVQQTAMRRGEV